MDNKIFIVYQVTNVQCNKIFVGYYSGKNIPLEKIQMKQPDLVDHMKLLYGKSIVRILNDDIFKIEVVHHCVDKKEMKAKYKSIATKEFCLREDIYNKNIFNKVQCIDKDGNHFLVDTSDSRYISGELTLIFKNEITLKDDNGNKIRLKRDDERCSNGSLHGLTKGKGVIKNRGKFCAKDKDGNRYMIDKNDERYISGELISIVRKHEPLVKIPKVKKEPKIKIKAKTHDEIRTEKYNFSHTIKNGKKGYYFIENYCEKHGDLNIQSRLFNYIFEDNKNIPHIYCEKCRKEFINNYIPNEKEIEENIELFKTFYGISGNKMDEIYLFNNYPFVYRCIKLFTSDKIKNWNERCFLFKENMFEPDICAIKKCECYTKFTRSNSCYSRHCEKHTGCSFSSKNENEIYDFIKDYIDESLISKNERKDGYELDIYIPHLNLAFEHNGLWTHNEFKKKRDKKGEKFDNKLIHYEKWLYCKDKRSVKLITIWEDQWWNKTQIVKEIIKKEIGIYDNIIISSNYCELKEVNFTDSIEFLKENHIEGPTSSIIRLGLYNENELVSLMCFGTIRNDKYDKNNIELLRFCNKIGFDIKNSEIMLFNYFIKHYTFNKIIGNANLDIGNEKFYKMLGFTEKEWMGVDFWWSDNGERYNKNNKFIEYEIFSNDNKSKDDIMYESGYIKIYKNGYTRFEYLNKNI
jgi:hypothetical protein